MGTLLAWIDERVRRRRAQATAHELRAIARSLNRELAAASSGDADVARVAARLAGLARAWDRKPRLAILGDFNSGKTSLANLAVRQRVLSHSHLANTRRVILLSNDAAPGSRPSPVPEAAAHGAGDYDRLTVSGGRSVLTKIDLLDTPGSNDPGHVDPQGRLPNGCLDGAIWCSVATQCWKESERSTWQALPARIQRNSLLVVTCADAIRTPQDRRRLSDRLDQDAAPLFAQVVFLSTVRAAEVLDGRGRVLSKTVWDHSGARAFEAGVRAVASQIEIRRRDRGRRIARRIARRAIRLGDPAWQRRWWRPSLYEWRGQARRLIKDIAASRIPPSEGRMTFAVMLDSLLASLIDDPGAMSGRRHLAERIVAEIAAQRSAIEVPESASTPAGVANLLRPMATSVVTALNQLLERARHDSRLMSRLAKRLQRSRAYKD